MKHAFHALAGILALAAFGAAHADTDTQDFKVLLEIADSCSISTTTKPSDVDFGKQVRSTGSATANNGKIYVKCNKGASFHIGLNGGLNYGMAATVAGSKTDPVAGGRAMTNAGKTVYIPYELYSDAATTFWGNTVGTSTFDPPVAPDDKEMSFTVYGKVPSLDFPKGKYEDTITATVTF
ncbi:Csu type fimbrial protein [Ramlibacter humi]|uniref:SCPU domain-containing protein n=1 Tax=Ramlibacter humi TaxID=2530451 RepID=A0A4Z0CBP3_9BURK|nr:spore coat U domain-containing protein [Ramlibacter humi]TFZ08771.1 SCPU domain-containing protein [Ramlibacter humi]